MRLFYDGWPISQTPSAESNVLSTFQSVAGDAPLRALAGAFPLLWSALGGGWSVCQLDRQKGLPNKVLAREYKLALPDEKTLARELEMTQKPIANRQK